MAGDEGKERREEARLILPMNPMKPTGGNQANPPRASQKVKVRKETRVSPTRAPHKEKVIPRARMPLPPVRLRHKVKHNHRNRPGMSPGGLANGLEMTGQKEIGMDVEI